jgi:hypothetical protein
MGLLPPTGEAHPGGGRACLYSEDALLEAMLLQGLVDFGLVAVEARKILDQIRAEEPNLFDVPITKPRRGRTLLVIGKAYSTSNALNVSLRSPDELAKFIEKRLLSDYHVIDIEKLHDRLNEPEESK